MSRCLYPICCNNLILAPHIIHLTLLWCGYTLPKICFMFKLLRFLWCPLSMSAQTVPAGFPPCLVPSCDSLTSVLSMKSMWGSWMLGFALEMTCTDHLSSSILCWLTFIFSTRSSFAFLNQETIVHFSCWDSRKIEITEPIIKASSFMLCEGLFKNFLIFITVRSVFSLLIETVIFVESISNPKNPVPWVWFWIDLLSCMVNLSRLSS